MEQDNLNKRSVSGETGERAEAHLRRARAWMIWVSDKPLVAGEPDFRVTCRRPRRLKFLVQALADAVGSDYRVIVQEERG
jgi:hypothetical protein